MIRIKRGQLQRKSETPLFYSGERCPVHPGAETSKMMKKWFELSGDECNRKEKKLPINCEVKDGLSVGKNNLKKRKVPVSTT